MVFWTLGFIIFCFGVVLLVGAPYLPTLNAQKEAAFELLDLKPGETLLELGCGDGRMLVQAAKRGIYGVGYELNPILFIFCMLSTFRYRSHIKVIFGDYWGQKWPKADGIYVFLINKHMVKLDKKIKESCKTGIKVASNTFKIPGKKTVKQKEGVFLYAY